MRPIKFRGKVSPGGGEWIYGYYAFLSGMAMIGTGVLTSVDLETVGQYSSFSDEKGIEIYEGDIVYHETASPDDMAQGYGDRYEVRFSDGCFKLYDGRRVELLCDYYKCVEVVGNIHEPVGEGVKE